MAKINPHVHFDGRCEEAFRFYEKTLGGKISFSMKWGESPMAKEIGGEWAQKIIHAAIEIDGQIISADDAPPAHYSKPQGFAIVLSYQEASKAENIFRALSDKGDVKMPFAETFWAKGFGMVTDQFGIPWMVNCGKA
jgi:PhnB protein